MEISLTAQIGGPDAGSRFRKPIVKLGKSLKLLEDKIYDESLKKIKVFLRVSGEIEDYEESTGIYNLRFNKKSGIGSAEIIISNKSWQISDNINLLLSKLIEDFFDVISKYLIEKGIQIDRTELLEDIQNIVISNNNS